MATSGDVLCGLCESQEITKNAEYWCPECEGLCSDCSKYHKLAKASKHHQVISVENFKKLPKSISSIGHNCQKHDKLYQHYCKQHETLCCPVCIATDHKKCDDLLVIEDVIKTAKSSSMLESIEESVKFLKRNLQLLIDERAQNLVKNKVHQEKFLENIKNARKSINTHFDELEKRILREVSLAEKRINDRINNLSKELIEKLQVVKELEQDVVVVKDYASDLQAYHGSMSLKSKVEEEEKYLHSLIKKGTLKQILLKCSLDENIFTNILSLTRFGSVSTKETTTEINLDTRSNKRAQIMIEPILPVQKSINEIQLTLKCKFDFPARGILEFSYNITGCAIRQDGTIILVDNNTGKLIVFTERGDLKKEFKVSYNKPRDVTPVDNKTICVSYDFVNRLDLINTDSWETIQVTRTNDRCTGITSENRTLYWYEQNKGIQMKQQAIDDITSLVRAYCDDYWSYVSVHGDRIYQTSNGQKTVSCFKLDGEKIWQFKDESMINNPFGIAADNASNVYVADVNKGVFVVSADGKNCRQILGKDDGVCNCYALCFDKIHNILVVCNGNGPVFLYNISYSN